MEAFAYVEMHTRTCNELHLWYREVVSDDDSTKRSCLRHQNKDLIAAGLINEKVLATNKKGYKKTDNEKSFLIYKL